jgi:hypothetical protein
MHFFHTHDIVIVECCQSAGWQADKFRGNALPEREAKELGTPQRKPQAR